MPIANNSILTLIKNGYAHHQYAAIIKESGQKKRLEYKGRLLLTEALITNYVLVLMDRSDRQKTSYYIVQYDVRTQPYSTVELQYPGIQCVRYYNYIENDGRNYTILVFPNLNLFCYSGRSYSDKKQEVSLIIFRYPLAPNNFKISKFDRPDNKNILKLIKLNNYNLLND